MSAGNEWNEGTPCGRMGWICMSGVENFVTNLRQHTVWMFHSFSLQSLLVKAESQVKRSKKPFTRHDSRLETYVFCSTLLERKFDAA